MKSINRVPRSAPATAPRLRRLVGGLVWGAAFLLPCPGGVRAETAFRPPAVPLMVHNSYFSVWAFSENLSQADILNWTRTPNPITCLITIDGKTFRLMGDKNSPLPILGQKSLVVQPTRTSFVFANQESEVELSFISPVLVEDLKLLARPVSFIQWKVRALDGNPRDVRIYLDIEAPIALLDAAQQARFERVPSPGFALLRVGSVDQPVLGYRGDVVPVDWGYCYLGLPGAGCEGSGFGLAAPMREAFIQGRFKGESTQDAGPFRPHTQKAAMGVAIHCGLVGAEPVESKVMLGYDSSPELQYFSKPMESYWKNETPSFETLLKNSWADFPEVSARCAEFDKKLIADAARVGGESYARLISLLYRQVIGAHHLTRDASGASVYFSRENASNSSINTVDVTFPSSPFFLFHSTDLLKSLLVPILDYASSSAWKHDSSPHSIGTFPQATGQRYGGTGSPMPVEETGNMLMMIAGICQAEGNADFAQRYRALLDQWAGHLSLHGYDTGEQLCTDDFRGRQLHNTNLSVKGICGLAAYAKVLESLGEKEKSAGYARQAKAWARQWEKEALAPEGTHFMQAFGQPDTWSFKYNMIWDKLLGLGLFSPETYRKEFSYYHSKLEKYGVPMDYRDKKTKFDWNVWVACFADKREERDLLLNPLYKMVNESPTRLPLTDYFNTDTGTIAQFYARSVMGAVWMPLILAPGISRPWALRNPSKIKEWSPQAPHLKFVNVIESKVPEWRYTFEPPAEGWEKPAFDDSSWQLAKLPIGGERNTRWPEGKHQLWLRKTFKNANLSGGKIRMTSTYQDESEVFLNGRSIHETAPGSFVSLRSIELERIIQTSLSASDFGPDNVIAIRAVNSRDNPMFRFILEEVIMPVQSLEHPDNSTTKPSFP